jgi:hypothetical protein
MIFGMNLNAWMVNVTMINVTLTPQLKPDTLTVTTDRKSPTAAVGSHMIAVGKNNLGEYQL